MVDVSSITSGALIAAEKVNGSTVYNLSGDKLGSVEDILIDKVSGQAVYALLSFGGFLGLGEKHHPLPWGILKYDGEKDGYVINLDKKKLQDSPDYEGGDNFVWTREYGEKVDHYYDFPRTWI